jgi:succinate dehydrogenase / fumarate reductase, cytochrome b subunit
MHGQNECGLASQFQSMRRDQVVSHGLRSVVELVRYRGRLGQLEWAFHRISGLAVVLFLLVHIADTSTVHFAPSAYAFFVALYKNPFFGLGEIALAAAVIYHAMNGLRVIIMDFWPHLYARQALARWIVWAAFVILWVPTAGVMLVRIAEHALLR